MSCALFALGCSGASAPGSTGLPRALSAATVPRRDYGPDFARITGDTARAKARPSKLRLGPAISVTTARLVPDGKARASGHLGPSGKCSIKILHTKPKTAARTVASIKISGTSAQRDDLWSLLKHKACEAGANAVLVKDADESSWGTGYHIEALALVLKTADSGKHKPIPKTITVPADSSAAIPETITIAPDTPTAAKKVTAAPGAAAPRTVTVDSGTPH